MSSKNTNLTYLWVSLLLVVAATGPATGGQVISTADIEDCLVNELGIDCKAKTVVTIPVTYGMETTLEAVPVTTSEKDGEPQSIESTTPSKYGFFVLSRNSSIK